MYTFEHDSDVMGEVDQDELPIRRAYSFCVKFLQRSKWCFVLRQMSSTSKMRFERQPLLLYTTASNGSSLVHVYFRGRKNLTHKVISMNGFIFLLCSSLFTEWQQSSLKNTCFFWELKIFQLTKNQINSVESFMSSEKNAFGFWKYFDWAQMCFLCLKYAQSGL